jgi:hypothetical protein
MKLGITSFNRGMNKDREHRIFCALEESKTMPVASTAKKHAIPRGTLRDRKKGSTNRHNAQIKYQKLDENQERFLADWILNEEDAGRAPSKKNIREFAQLILKYDNQDFKIGHNWVKPLHRSP